MHFVYQDGTPLPPDIAAGVVRVPPGISDKFPRGGFFTDDGIQVTQLKDATDQPFGSPLQGQQDAGAYTKVEAGPELQAQLDRLEATLKTITG